MRAAVIETLGQPLVAVTAGTVFSVGYDTNGGNQLWLVDASGNQFYYAHLSAFSSLAVNGAHVKAGEVIVARAASDNWMPPLSKSCPNTRSAWWWSVPRRLSPWRRADTRRLPRSAHAAEPAAGQPS